MSTRKVSKTEEIIRPHLRSVQTYDPVDPSEVLAEEAGIPLDQVIRLNGNENPFGCSPKVIEAIGALKSLHIYPDPQQRQIRRTLSQYTGLDSKNIIAGSGCDEIIDLLLRLFLEPGDEVIECDPTFGMYAFSTRVCGGTVKSVPRNEPFDIDLEGVKKAINKRTKMVFIASPNNPTGNLTSEEQVRALLETGIMVVVDETYFEFSKCTLAPFVKEYDNLAVLRSLSKWAGLAGLRIGYGMMSPFLARHILDIKSPYNINTAAETALIASINDAPHLLRNVDEIIRERESFFSALKSMKNVKPWPSHANFILCEFQPGLGQKVYKGLARKGIFVRYFGSSRVKDCIRISIGTKDQMDKVLSALQELTG